MADTNAGRRKAGLGAENTSGMVKELFPSLRRSTGMFWPILIELVGDRSLDSTDYTRRRTPMAEAHRAAFAVSAEHAGPSSGPTRHPNVYCPAISKSGNVRRDRRTSETG